MLSECHFHLVSMCICVIITEVLLANSTAICPCGCRCRNNRIDCSQTLCRFMPFPQFPKRTTHLDLSDNDLEYIPVNIFAEINKLRSLNLRLNKLTSFPKGINQLEELRRLDLSDNRIENITSEDLLSIATVASVNLRRNKIFHLPETHLVTLPLRYLKTLDLSENSIDTLEANTFNAFLTMTNLNLSFNKLISIDRNAFSGLTSLRYLYLQGNQLKRIESLTFRPLVMLTHLDLSWSLITSFGDGAFLDVGNLRSLNLTHNHIDKIGGWLFGLISLTTIDLSYNNIEYLEEGEASMWTLTLGLEWVSLAHNHITYIPKTFQILKNLKYLYLDHNQIRDIANDAFLGLHQLAYLDLSGNLLNEFFENGEAFKGSQLSLKELVISSNGISTISATMFEHIAELESLDINHNPISQIKMNAFQDHQLRSLVMNTSSMICDCNFKWFYDWFRLSNISEATVNIKCSYPNEYNGTYFLDLEFQLLSCDVTQTDLLPQPRLLNHSKILIKSIVGDTSKLTCNVTGAAPLDIGWNVYKDGRKILATQSVENYYADIVELQDKVTKIYVYSELVFKNISFEDEAEYRCSARNLYGAVHSPKITFTVEEEPVLTILPENMTADIGSTAAFRCAARGKPLPTLKWQKEGGTMLAAEEKRLYVKSDEDSFYITDVRKSDEGLYKCVAENSLGRAEASAILTVSDPHEETEWNFR